MLDLPQLYTKPPARTLLSTLDDLSSDPPSWETTPRSGTPRSQSGTSTPFKRRPKVRSEGLPHYLTKIISSPLAWIDDDGEKEQVWEAASQRLSERSGRTGRGAMSRILYIPLTPTSDVPNTPLSDDTALHSAIVEDDDNADPSILPIHLHEPALTADNLGLKTWASSYLLAKRLVSLQKALPCLPPDAKILELGAGTGLVGMAAAAILQRQVYLTDLAAIVPNLERNVRANALAVAGLGGGEMRTGTLDWSDPGSVTFSLTTIAGPGDAESEMQILLQTFPLLLAADPLYSPDHPALLTTAIAYHLSRSAEARVVVEIPLREGFASEREDFTARMLAMGLEVRDEGEEVGYDDWGGADDRDGEAEGGVGGEVRCWWSVWGWAAKL